MSKLFLITAFFLLLFANVAAADPDTAYWGLVGKYPLAPHESFNVSGYTATLDDQRMYDIGHYGALLSITKNGATDFEIMNTSDVVFIDNNHTQIEYVETDFNNHQVFIVWTEKTPSFDVSSRVTKVVNMSAFDIDINMLNSVNSAAAYNITETVTLPAGCTMSGSTTLYSDIFLNPSNAAAKSFRLYYTHPVAGQQIKVNVAYTFSNNTRADSCTKYIILPPENITTPVVATAMNEVIPVIPTTTLVATSSSTFTQQVTTINGGTTTQALVSTAASVPIPVVPVPTRIVSYRSHADPPPQAQLQPITTTVQNNITIKNTAQSAAPTQAAQTTYSGFARNEKGMLLLGVLLTGWFIIYKL